MSSSRAIQLAFAYFQLETITQNGTRYTPLFINSVFRTQLN